MVKKIFMVLAAVPVVLLVLSITATAGTHDFFKDKTVRIIVGNPPGGGVDLTARIIARHMGKKFPGNPRFLVENMTGAGGLISANHLYKIAKPDGLTMGHFIGGFLLDKLLDRPGIEFEPLKFEYVGAPMMDRPACALTKSSGITSVEKWYASKVPVKLGGTGTGATVDMPKILKVALGLPIQLVFGYKGTADVRLAADNGEIAGGCWSWPAIKATWRARLEAGEVVVVLQASPDPHPDLQNVPQAIQLAKTEEARQLIRTGIHNVSAIQRPFVLPPGTPKQRVQILRKAFMETLKDREFLEESGKAKLEIDPLTGEDLEEAVGALFKLDPATVNKLREVLK